MFETMLLKELKKYFVVNIKRFTLKTIWKWVNWFLVTVFQAIIPAYFLNMFFISAQFKKMCYFHQGKFYKFIFFESSEK